MARPKGKDNKRLKLQIPTKLIEALDYELEYLRIGERIIVSEEGDRPIKSRNDFLRWQVCYPWLQRFWGGSGQEPFDFDEETSFLDFYMDRVTKGFWDQGIRDGAAVSYNNLASLALYDYLQRRETLSESLRLKLPELKRQMAEFDPEQWRSFLLTG